MLATILKEGTFNRAQGTGTYKTQEAMIGIIAGKETKIRRRELFRGIEFQVIHAGRIVTRCETYKQALEWVNDNKERLEKLTPLHPKR